MSWVAVLSLGKCVSKFLEGSFPVAKPRMCHRQEDVVEGCATSKRNGAVKSSNCGGIIAGAVMSNTQSIPVNLRVGAFFNDPVGHCHSGTRVAASWVRVIGPEPSQVVGAVAP